MSEHAMVGRNEINPAVALEAEIDEAIALCHGDIRAALRAMLVANAYLEAEAGDLMRKVSQGYARKRKPKPVSIVPPGKIQPPE